MTILEPNKAYIQKNPLWGRRVLYVERLRESVWDWNLLDLTVVKLDDAPEIEQWRGLASSAYDHQSLEEMPVVLFRKILQIARLYEMARKAAGVDKLQPQANEALATCLQLLADHDVIDTTTYDNDRLLAFAAEYERDARMQMERVTDVIDVHK